VALGDMYQVLIVKRKRRKVKSSAKKLAERPMEI
jgi:hypothetical protein